MDNNKDKIIAEQKEQLLKIQQNRKNGENLVNLEYQLLNDDKLLKKVVDAMIDEKDFEKISNLLTLLNKIKNNVSNEIINLNFKKQKIEHAILALNDSFNIDDYIVQISTTTHGTLLDVKYDKINNGDMFDFKIHVKIKDKFRIHIKDEFNRLLILKMREDNGKVINYNIQYDLSQIDTNTNVVIGSYYLTR